MGSIDGDLITGFGGGNIVGFEVPSNLDPLPRERLRYDGVNVIDIAAITDFFIDSIGRKHIAQADAAWQSLSCGWDAVLVDDAGTWRVETPAEQAAVLGSFAIELVNRAAGVARMQVITDAPGQAEVYMQKESQARAFASAGYSGAVPAFVQAEADASSVSTQVAADFIIATADAWWTLAANIDRERRTGIVAIDAAVAINNSAAIAVARDASVIAIDSL